MPVNAENLRFILGLKLKRLRLDQGLSLKDLAQRCGLSISYLSEIEKGKKYPKAEKLIALAEGLGVPYDDLVSMQVAEDLLPIKSLFSSTFFREFPFDLFGLQLGDLFGLIKERPEQAWALVRTFLEIGTMYDVRVEHFLFAALRSYQQSHANYFDDLEEAAAAFRRRLGARPGDVLEAATLRGVLVQDYGYDIDEETLPGHPHLGHFRSVYRDSTPPRLLVNGRMLPSQRAFIFAREIGYRHLGYTTRALTSSWLKVESFEQVFNNFRASYFAGALLLDQEALSRAMTSFFRRKRWDPVAFLAVMDGFRATPEMFYYRLTQLLPKRFGLRDLYFVRFNHDPATDTLTLAKVLNLSEVAVPHGLWLNEHHCRLWPDYDLLRRLGRRQAGDDPEAPLATAQRSHFEEAGLDYFVLSTARPLTLSDGKNSCVSIGFRMTDAFRRTVRFLDDPAVPERTVNLTCERCGLADCPVRTAPPTLFRAAEQRRTTEAALSELLKEE